MKRLFLLALLSLPVSAYAVMGTTTWTITIPTVRDDGDPMPLSEIKELAFYDKCNTATPALLFKVAPNATVTKDIDYTDKQQYSMCYSVIDTDSFEGVKSNAYNFTFDSVGKPGKGNITTIVITCLAQKCKVIVSP